MKVSVVIPVHNEEASIEAAIELLKAQTHTDLEIIVVDNNSTDRTNERASATGVKVLLEKRKGTQWARECGRKAAQGEIIATMDADCLPDADWVEKAVRHFSLPEVVAVGGPYYYYDASAFFRDFSLFFQQTFYVAANYVLQKLHKGAVLIGGNTMFLASAMEKAGGFNTGLVFYGDDTDTAKRLATQGKVVFDKKLAMKTSARRLNERGSITISLVYMYHFFRIIFTK